MPAEVNVAIIGAGVVGLAVAAEVARSKKGLLAFEKNRTFGLETSSHCSEVIHAGIYYPEDSLKARLCVEGRNRLYELCQRYEVDHSRLGKLIVAVNEGEVSQLEKLYQQGIRNGVTDLRLLSLKELKKLEPNIAGVAGLFSPSTGIVDAHSLMKFYHHQARGRGAEFIFNTEVVGVERVGGGYKVLIRDREGISSLTTNYLINSAGLNSDKIAYLAGIDTNQAGYQIHYCKGEYFSLDSRWQYLVSRLVYPVPEQAGLGVHITSSLDGRMRLGPNVRYVDEIDYQVDETKVTAFYESGRKFMPRLELEDLVPDFAGIRPKLQAPGEAFRDFVIADEGEKGFPGLINLIGIESPGLTACPAIARYVAEMLK